MPAALKAPPRASKSKEPPKSVAEQLWADLEPLRHHAIDAAKKCCSLTLPYLLPEQTSGYMKQEFIGFTHHPAPRSDVNGRAPQVLAAKVTGALFPQNTTYAYLEIVPGTKIPVDVQQDDGTVANAEVSIETLDEKGKADMDIWLGRVMKRILSEIGSRNIIQAVEMCELNSIGTGSLLFHMPERKGDNMRTGRARALRMDQYVVDCDPYGNLVTLVVQEKIHFRALPPSVREVILDKYQDKKPAEKIKNDTYTLFTVVRRTLDSDASVETAFFEEFQECEGVEIPGTRTEYKNGKTLRWVFLPWKRVPNSPWGIGHVETHYGLHATHEGLSAALQIKAAIAADTKKLVKPGSMIDIDEYVSADPGSVLTGDPDGIGEGRFNPPDPMLVIAQLQERIGQKIEQAYGIVDYHPVERRTTVEARQMALEVNAINGGVFSLHSEGLQRPIVEMLLDEIVEDEALFPPRLKKIRGKIRPRVVAGLDALSRADQLTNWSQWLALVQAAEAAGVSRYSDRRNLYHYTARAVGLDIQGVILSREDIEKIDQNAMALEMLKGVPATLAGRDDLLGGQAAPAPQ